MIGVLRKLKMNISRKCLNQMFLSYIKPILEYADVVWDVWSPLGDIRLFVCLFGFNVALKHLRSYHDGACL